MSAIADIIAREVLDSRGNPTVEAEVVLETGARDRPIKGPIGRDPASMTCKGSSTSNSPTVISGPVPDWLPGLPPGWEVKQSPIF